MTGGAGLRVLVVDDVAPALDEMCQLLREAPGVGVGRGGGGRR